MSRFLSTARCALIGAVVMVMLLLSARQVRGQAETATLSGTATDSSGAALVNANVEAKNVATNNTQSANTDSGGHYKISSLPVGTYDVSASLTGFQTVIHTGVVLSVGGNAILDFSLPVGKVTETVQVESQVSRVETTTSEVSTLVSPSQIQELPLNGRNFTQLLTLAPGVTTIPASVNTANFVVGRMYGAMDNYSVSGSRPTGQMFLLDGVDIRDFWEHSTGSGYGGTNLGVEGIGEFQVLTNTYNAQFAGNGVVMNAASRYGTNDLHGGAYEYIRNSALDAAALQDQNAAAQAAFYGVKIDSPPPFRRNQFGGDLGGAVKKDKLFFFGNYEGMRQELNTTNTPIYMPMAYTFNGELPCNMLPGGYAGCPAVQPLSPILGGPLPGAAGNPIVAVQPYNGSALAVSNVALMSNILKVYSLCQTCTPSKPLTASNGNPNVADAGGYYQASDVSKLGVNEDYVLGRVDYNIGSKDSIFSRYVFDNATVADPRDPMEIYPETDHTRNQFLVITEKHIVSSTMINSVRAGYTRVKEASATPFHLSSAQLTAAGLAADPLDFVGADGYPNAANLPDGTVGSLGNSAFFQYFPGLGPDADRPDSIVQSKFSGGDDLVWTHGGHSLKIGGVVQRVDTNNDQLAYSAGESFLGWSGAGDLSFQSAFEGLPDFGFEVVPGYYSSTRYFREIGFAPYIQDDWKVSSRLTLNLGMRYDYFTNPVGWAGNGIPLTQVPGSFLPPMGPEATAPNCAGINQSVSTVAYAQCRLGIYTPVKHVFASDPNAANWAPRVGFAYDPFADHKTSIRGGFGVFHDPVAARIYESGIVFTPPSSSVEAFNLFGAPLDPCMPNPFAVVAGYCGSLNPAPGEFAAVSYQVPNGSPYVMQYNLGVQRQILSGTILSVSYVGSAARHMWMQRDENPPQCTTFPDCSAVPASTAAGANTGACFISGRLNLTTFGFEPGCGPAFGPAGSTTIGEALPHITSNFASRVMEAETSASAYNSLQVSLNRQFSKNIAGQLNYSWSHCIDDGSFATSLEFWGQLQTDPYNQKYDYGNCLFDIRHNLVGNVLYSLPFKGNRLVEGWQVASIVSFNTGTPTNVTNTTTPGADPSELGAQWATRPNYTFAAGCNPDQMINQWVTLPDVLLPGVKLREYEAFNPNCYTPQDFGYVGNVRRDGVPGLHLFNTDLSVLKNTKITEKLNAQFRAEFFNIGNKFNPGAPTSIIGGFGPAFPMGNSFSLLNNPRQIQFALKLLF